jgi:hypothetical protein
MAEKPVIDAWEIYREHLNQDVEKMTPSPDFSKG